MTAPLRQPATGDREGPCARCIIGAIVGTAVAAAMLLLTVRFVSALARGELRRS